MATLQHLDFLITILTFVSFLLAYSILKAVVAYRNFKKKMAILSQGEETVLSTTPEPTQNHSIMKTVYSQREALQKWFGTSFKNGSSQVLSTYKDTFEQAGWDPINALPIVAMSKLLLVAGAALIYLFIFTSTTLLDNITFPVKVIILLGLLFVASMSFDYYLKYKVHVRYTSIRRDLPTALDLLVICASSGLSVDKTFEQVAQEIGRYNPHLGKELALTSIELSLLPSRRSAYENLARRVRMPLILGLTTTLIQAEEQGTSLSETLTALSDEFRLQIALDAEARAGRLPSILSVPIVLFTLPSLLIIIAGPAIANIFRNFS